MKWSLTYRIHTEKKFCFLFMFNCKLCSRNEWNLHRMFLCFFFCYVKKIILILQQVLSDLRKFRLKVLICILNIHSYTLLRSIPLFIETILNVSRSPGFLLSTNGKYNLSKKSSVTKWEVWLIMFWTLVQNVFSDSDFNHSIFIISQLWILRYFEFYPSWVMCPSYR